jgi:vacuolar-type H+-ATPase subunit C/Vma6
MKSARLLYLVTRVHGLMTHLLKPDEIQKLVNADNVQRLAEQLMATDYSSEGELRGAVEISRPRLEKLRASELEEIFLRKMVSRLFFISSISPVKIKEFVLAYSRRFEFENIKRVIRAKHSGEKVEQLIPLTGEQTSVNFEALLEAEDLATVIKMLPERRYAPSAESLNLYNEYNTTLVLESQLDKIYYRAVLRAAKKLKDRDVIRLIGMEIDVRNILTLLTMNFRKVKPELVEHLIIPGGTLRGGRLISIVQTGVGEIQSLLEGTPFAKSVGGAVEARGGEMEMYRVEAALLAPFFERVKSTANKSLGVSYVLGYLIRSEIEAKNLIAITMAKQLKLSVEILQDIVLI